MKTGPRGEITFDSDDEVPATGHSLGTMAANRTGSWRNVEPYYQDLTPPCSDACPAGGDISLWLALAAEGRFAEAVGVLRRANPLPAICGRVCPHPCETACLRRHYGGAISVAQVERFLGDWAIQHGDASPAAEKQSKRIAIVGAGPAGLSAAFHLARLGYPVTILDAQPAPGGLLRYGIPPFRLPRTLLDAEIDLLRALPIEFRMSRRLGTDFGIDDLLRFDAALIAIGRQRSRELGIPGEERAISGIDLLRQGTLELGERVAILGGGSTAFDCARTLRRKGKSPVILYRRSEKELPAFAHDVEEAAEEGIEIRYCVAPVTITDGELHCVRTALGAPDASGRRRPEPVAGSEFTLRVDAVIKAVGEVLDGTGLNDLVDSAGIAVGASFETRHRGLYACGDCAGGAGTVSDAIGRGRLAAAAIAKGKSLRPVTLARGADSRVVQAENLNPAYLASDPRPIFDRAPAGERVRGFGEVNAGMNLDAAVHEARRCMSCGTCILCHNCMNYCPDGAIRFTGTGYAIDYDYCKGCLICAKECPRGALSSRESTNAKSHQR